MGVAGKKIGQAVIVGYIQFVPVVKPRPLQIFVCNLKAEGSDKMQPCAGYSAGAGYVPGVLRYLRLNKYNVKVFNDYRLFPLIVIIL